MMNKRLILDITAFICILFLPYWVYLPVLLVNTILFPFYWEGIMFGVLIDAIFGPARFSIYSVGLAMLLLNVILLPIRSRLRW